MMFRICFVTCLNLVTISEMFVGNNQNADTFIRINTNYPVVCTHLIWNRIVDLYSCTLFVIIVFCCKSDLERHAFNDLSVHYCKKAL